MITVRTGGTTRAITDFLEQAGVVVNLTGASVDFVLRDLEDASVMSASAAIVSAVDGSVSYTLQPVDVETAGRYEYEWHVTTSASASIVLPEAGPRPLRVVDALA